MMPNDLYVNLYSGAGPGGCVGHAYRSKLDADGAAALTRKALLKVNANAAHSVIVADRSEIKVEPEVWNSVKRAAERKHLSPEALVNYALQVYCASQG